MSARRTPEGEPVQSWLSLLLADADLDVLEAHRLRQRRAATTVQARAQLDDESRRATQLHAFLGEHRQRVFQQRALYDLALRLSGVRDLDALLQEIVTQGRRLLDVDIAYIALVEEAGSLDIKVTDGSLGPHLRGISLLPHSGLAGRVVDTGEPVSTTDYLGDPGLTHLAEADSAAGSEGIRSILGVPLRLRGEVIGVLMVAHRAVRPFSDNEVSLLCSLAAFGAVAIEGARLFEAYRGAAADLAAANDELRRQAEAVTRAAVLHERLMDVALRGGGVGRVIASLSEVIEGEVAFADDQDRLVAGAAKGRPASHVTLAPVDGAPPSAAFQDPAVRRSRVSGQVTTVPVASGDTYFGALQVTSDGELHELDIRLLERSALTIALVASAELSVAEAERRTVDELLERLLTDRIDDPAAFDRQARRVGLVLANPHVVVVVEPPRGEEGRALARLGELVARQGGLVGRLRGALIALVRSEVAYEVRGAVSTEPNLGTAGISAPAVGTLALALAYQDARACVTVLHALGRSGGHAGPDDLGPYRFLLSHAGRLDALRFVQLTIGALLDQDALRGTDLARTADAYLTAGRHHADAAARLHVHPNTLYQRLERIGAILGADWRTGDRAVDIQLALRLHRLCAVVPEPAPSLGPGT
ncbi:MAG: helix-turn-helix domain-containing protein [Mycobacteriales bacterium]